MISILAIEVNVCYLFYSTYQMKNHNRIFVIESIVIESMGIEFFYTIFLRAMLQIILGKGLHILFNNGLIYNSLNFLLRINNQNK